MEARLRQDTATMEARILAAVQRHPDSGHEPPSSPVGLGAGGQVLLRFYLEGR